MVFCFLTFILILCIAAPFAGLISDAVASCPIAVDTRPAPVYPLYSAPRPFLYLDGSTSLTLAVGAI